jgi:hypothetical protein
MRFLILLLALAPFARPVAAQPADCPSWPAPTQNMPLALDLNGLPGVPNGLAGQVYADVPMPPPGGTVSATAAPDPAPDAPYDVLRGPPGDLLRGNGPRDILGGRARPRIEIVAPKLGYAEPE